MARQPLGSIAGAAFGLLIAIGAGLASPAHADAQEVIVGTQISLPFASQAQGNEPMEPYRLLIAELRDRAKREVGSEAGFEPLVASEHWGWRGDKLLIGAVTPRRGVFFVVDAGPYPVGANQPVPPPAQMPVCRFEVDWVDLPSGANAQSLSWVGLFFPPAECGAAPDNLALFQQWRAASTAASYSVVGDASDGVLRVWLVQETLQTGSLNRPFDIGKAAALVLEQGDSVMHSVPAIALGWNAAVLLTQSGRVVTALSERPFGIREDRRCLVTGLLWSSIAEGYNAQIARAQELCIGVERAQLERERASRPPPKIEVQILETRDGPF